MTCLVFKIFLNSTFIRMTPQFRSKLLEFDLVGEGNLPSVCVLRPVLKSREGSPMLQFRRVLVGHRCTLPLVLNNDGIVPAQVRDGVEILSRDRH